MNRFILRRLMHFTALPIAICVAFLAVVAPHLAVAADKKEPARIPASDSRALRENLGQQVTVFGHVSRTGKSNSGINFLNFASAEITGVCHPEVASQFSDGQPADIFRNADVEITGKIELYRGKLQVEIDGPQSIRRIEPKKSPNTPTKIQLKQLGEDHWVSPAGVHYRGRDPDGRTRLDHVLRHAQDNPQRDGPHGVFDNGCDGALATIDAAWSLVQKHKIKPEIEGDRASYTISMGRKIGYLGGSLGADRNHPPLTRVFIVVKRDTSEVVTAFPR